MGFGLKAKVDEDEGFLPQGRINPDTRSGKNREISGCPLGQPDPNSFPPNEKSTNNPKGFTHSRKKVALAKTLEDSICVVLLAILGRAMQRPLF
jgi:hypothetical protein